MSYLKKLKTAKKKEEILRSASAVLAEKGYQGTTMEEIASKLLMTKGSMYYYFKNKNELLYSCHLMIMEMSIHQISEIINSNAKPQEKLRLAIKDHILLATNEKSMFKIMDKPYQNFSDKQLLEVLELRKKYSSYFDSILQDGIKQQEFEKVNVKIARMIILGAINDVQEWYKQEGTQSREEIANIYADYLLKIVLS